SGDGCGDGCGAGSGGAAGTGAGTGARGPEESEKSSTRPAPPITPASRRACGVGSPAPGRRSSILVTGPAMRRSAQVSDSRPDSRTEPSGPPLTLACASPLTRTATPPEQGPATAHAAGSPSIE